MDNYLINKEDSFEILLSKEHYFQSLLQVIHSNNLLSTRDIENIQLQLMSILEETVGYYTKNKSFSVRVETAEQILLSICYTVGLFLKRQSKVSENVKLLKEKEIKYLFDEGQKILKFKVEECRRLLEVVKEGRVKSDNYAYLDTIDYAIPLFFKDYDLRFASHETAASIDYPLSIDEMNLVGVEYIENYLENVILENKFCSYFEAEEIEALLKGFNKNCDHMLISIFQFVLTNYLGCILVGKGGRSLDITKVDRVYLKRTLENLSKLELEELILGTVDKISKELSIEDKDLIEYINKALSKVTPEIRRNIETDTLKNIFITLSLSKDNVIKYVDGESVSNKRFKCVSEEIRDCISVQNKIKIIREEFHSLKDLMDILSADCIFDNEFIDIFKALDDFEIALLIKSSSNNENLEADYGTESEKEWQGKLKIYLESLDDMKSVEILRMSHEIEL